MNNMLYGSKHFKCAKFNKKQRLQKVNIYALNSHCTFLKLNIPLLAYAFNHAQVELHAFEQIKRISNQSKFLIICKNSDVNKSNTWMRIKLMINNSNLQLQFRILIVSKHSIKLVHPHLKISSKREVSLLQLPRIAHRSLQ